MIPRPTSHAQTRLTMLRANHGFSGVISQSAKTSRGSRFAGNSILVPSGKTAAGGTSLLDGTVASCEASLATFTDVVMAAFPGAVLPGTLLPLSGSQKMCSSFHSAVGL